jgi:hypothetical protein
MTHLNGLDNCPFCNLQITDWNGLSRITDTLDLYSIDHYCEKLKGRIKVGLTKSKELKEQWNTKNLT